VFAVLRNDALAAELAGVGKDRRAVALQMLAILDPGPGLAEQFLQSCLALLKRTGPLVLAVELQQIKGIQERLIVVGTAVQLFEHRHAGVIAADSFAIDHHRRRP
jgi:hypothetical protein